MAIFSQQTNSNPMVQTEMSINLSTGSIATPGVTPAVDFCFCDFSCEYVATVFAGNTDYETDLSDFLVEIPDTLTGSFSVKLLNVFTGVETPLLTNDYGTLFNLGDFPTQPLKGGYLIDWGKVRDVIGYGSYRVIVEQNFFGQQILTETNVYRLIPYSARSANRTVKIEMVKNGFIEGGIDYRGMNWLSSARIPGKFGFKTPRLERDSYENTSRQVVQIQDKVINQYRLETDMLPSNIFDSILEDGFMANQIFITDYGAISYNDLRKVEVVPTNYTETNTYANNRHGRFVIEFDEKTQNKIKRN